MNRLLSSWKKQNQISGNIEEDFFDEWIDTASKRNSDYARKLWGRILARKLIEPDSISLRALYVLRQMDRNEAETFRRLAPYALENIIMDTKDSEITPIDAILLSDAGILESASRVGSFVSCPGDPVAFSGAQWGLLVHLDATKLDKYKVLEVGGHALTPTGQKLLKVPDLEPITQDVLKVIFDGLQERNGNIISISAHPMVGNDMIDTQITLCEYKPD